MFVIFKCYKRRNEDDDTENYENVDSSLIHSFKSAKEQLAIENAKKGQQPAPQQQQQQQQQIQQQQQQHAAFIYAQQHHQQQQAGLIYAQQQAAINNNNYVQDFSQTPPTNMQSGQNQCPIEPNYAGLVTNPNPSVNSQMASQHSFLSATSSISSEQAITKTKIVIQDNIDENDDEETIDFPI